MGFRSVKQRQKVYVACDEIRESDLGSQIHHMLEALREVHIESRV